MALIKYFGLPHLRMQKAMSTPFLGFKCLFVNRVSKTFWACSRGLDDKVIFVHGYFRTL